MAMPPVMIMRCRRTGLATIDLWNLPCVEPKRRMVGGRFGWAVHRFPIKGGITRWEAHLITLRDSLGKPAVLAGFVAAIQANVVLDRHFIPNHAQQQVLDRLTRRR